MINSKKEYIHVPKPILRIDTRDAEPIYIKPRRTNIDTDRIIEKHINEMLQKGIIRPSKSPWGAPVLVVPKPKKEGEYRFCTDFRKLNDVTISDNYPLPHTQDIFDAMQGCQFLSTIDILNDFMHIHIHTEDIERHVLLLIKQ